MDRQRFVDRILESENLTDELEDTEAQWLINWGTEQLNLIIVTSKDEAAVGEKVTALMAVIQKINRIAGFPPTTEAESLSSDLAFLKTLFNQAFDHDQGADDTHYLAAAKHMISLKTTSEKLLFLTHWGQDPFVIM
jgi:hypothetical protein